MRLAALLTLVAMAAQAQGLGRFDRFCRQRGDRGILCDNLALFEFAPVSGAGMGTPCAGTAITGAKGEVATSTRASNGTCTKTTGGGLATSGIANGDLVVLTTNQPRVEYGSDGVLGYLSEATATNNALWSQEMNRTGGSPYALGTTSGATAATLDATDTIVAPDGTTTAETFTFYATTAVQESYVGQFVTSAQYVLSIYVKGASGSGTIDLCGNAGGDCSPCAYVSTGWVRCSRAATAARTNYYIGNNSAANGGTTRPQQTVYLWGFQLESTSYMTSYIPTTTVAVTRAVDLLTFPAVTSVASTGCAAATFTPAYTGTVGPAASALLTGGTSGRYLYALGTSSAGVRVYDGTNEISSVNSNHTTGAARRFLSTWTGSTLTLKNVTDVLSGSGTFTGTMSTSTLEIGAAGWGGVGLNGIVTRVQLDPSTGRCQ